MRQFSAVLATTMIAFLALFVPTTASAVTPTTITVQDLVDEVIDTHGGQQSSWNEVSWDGGDIVLTIDPGPSNSAAKVAPLAEYATSSTSTCPAGRCCAWNYTHYRGDRLTFATCPATVTSFTTIGSVRSVYNARTSGTVRAYSGTALKATVTAGKGATNVSGITTITCTQSNGPLSFG